MKSTFRQYLIYLGIALLLAIFIRTFLCNFYHIPSDSMEPAILPGDFILADKWTYGARIFTSLKFDSNSDPPVKRVPGFGNIKRNDILFFNILLKKGNAEFGIIRSFLKSKIRCLVEHVFGYVTNSMHDFYIQPVGFVRAKWVVGQINLLYNMCRYEKNVRLNLLPIKS